MNALPVLRETGDWRGGLVAESTLAPLVEINAQCVELLCQMARRPTGVLPPLLAGAPRAWRELTPGACLRLAGVPWLLVDAGFNDSGLWRETSAGGVRELAPALVVAPLSGLPFFGSDARDFFRRVLMFSWHLVRTRPQLARIALGIHPAAAQVLSRYRLAELDALAERYPGALRPRWELSPGLWRQLLAAAEEDDCTCVAEASLQGIQMLAATCLPPAPARTATLRA
jgi:hypothetical protein